MKKSRALLGVAAVAALSLGAAACGDDDDTPSTPEAPVVETGDDAATGDDATTGDDAAGDVTQTTGA